MKLSSINSWTFTMIAQIETKATKTSPTAHKSGMVSDESDVKLTMVGSDCGPAHKLIPPFFSRVVDAQYKGLISWDESISSGRWNFILPDLHGFGRDRFVEGDRLLEAFRIPIVGLMEGANRRVLVLGVFVQYWMIMKNPSLTEVSATSLPLYDTYSAISCHGIRNFGIA